MRHLDAEDGLRAGVRCRAAHATQAASPVETSTRRALQPIGRQRAPSVRIAACAGLARSSIRIAGTAMKVSAIVPPTQTVAARTWATTRDDLEPVRHGPSLCTTMQGWSARTGTASTARGACCSGPSRTAFSSPRSETSIRAVRSTSPAAPAGTPSGLLSAAGGSRASTSPASRSSRRAGSQRSAGWRSSGSRPTCSGWRPFDAAFDLIVVLYLQLPAEQLAAVLRRAAGAARAGRDAARRRPPPRQPRPRLGRPEGPGRSVHAGAGGGIARRPADREGRRGAAPRRGRAGRDRRARAGAPLGRTGLAATGGAAGQAAEQLDERLELLARRTGPRTARVPGRRATGRPPRGARGPRRSAPRR